MSRRTEQALILQRVPYGESSLVVRALTRNDGPVHLLARGAHRAKSAFAWTLDLFDELELTYRKPRGGGLATLEKGTVLLRRAALPKNLAAYKAALCGLELCDMVARPGVNEHKLYEFLSQLLGDLNQSGAEAPDDALLARFEAQLLGDLGLFPATNNCAECAGDAPAYLAQEDEAGPRVPFSAEAGGRLCETCALAAKKAGRKVGTLPHRNLAGLERALGGEIHQDRKLAQAVHAIAARFLDFHLGVLPRTHRQFASPAAHR